MYFTGLADEAARDLPTQIAITKELGWSSIESRNIDGVLLHELSDEAFERVVEQLDGSGVRINCVASGIANWGTSIDEPFDRTLGEARRAIARMQRLGTPLIRIMSFAIREDAAGRALPEQHEAERFRRLRELHAMFSDAGLTPVHENCMNYGGMGWTYTQRLLDEVPGLQLVFDTGNPVHSDDNSAQPGPDGRLPKQSAWEFYRHVRDHVIYIQVKDARMVNADDVVHTWPGEGDGDVRRILADMLARGYDGGISIEPHLASVFHDPSSGTSKADAMRDTYLECGRRIMAMVAEIRAEQAASAGG
ncbi:MAG: sugar phosphate isomerase/epimerase family protein [Chloroflexota bacterium]